MRLIALLSFALLSFSSATAATLVSADKLLINAQVYSLDWGEPDALGMPSEDAPFSNGVWSADANAIAIKANKILAVGDYSAIKDHVGLRTQIVDLKGATVVPGLIDSHVHIAELGEVLERINLAGIETPTAVIRVLKEHAKKLKRGEWLIAQGWDEGAWANNYPTRHMLDRAFPHNPVYLRSLHGFAVWANSKALKLAGVNKQTEPPIGGEILRDKRGRATGILLNRATTLIANAIPKPSVEQFAQYIKTGMQQMAADGYVAVHEAGAEALHIGALEYLRANNDLPIRMYAMLSSRDQDLALDWQSKGPLIDPEGFLDIRSVKAYYDGALGSRGARLLEDYSDMPGHRGVSGDGYGFDADLVEDLIGAGFQVAIHAIGDAGNREVLDFLASAEKRHAGSENLRHRIEHAQVISQDDFARFAQLNVIASMEPPHAVEDKTWAEDRIGPERIKGAYAWRSLRENKVRLTFNSDLPGSDHSIFYALHAAVTRRDKQSLPEEGWYPEQNVSIEEAVRAYTNWAAYSGFREKQTGVIKAGYWADLTIMNVDPFQLASSAPAEILNGEILMTLVDGEIVYQRKD